MFFTTLWWKNLKSKVAHGFGHSLYNTYKTQKKHYIKLIVNWYDDDDDDDGDDDDDDDPTGHSESSE